MAEEMYEYIIEKCRESVPVVERGQFGADMKVSLTNDGPFTIIFGFRETVEFFVDRKKKPGRRTAKKFFFRYFLKEYPKDSGHL